MILHVPHLATDIASQVRRRILLSDHELAIEIAQMTDAHTERIALDTAEAAVALPWVLSQCVTSASNLGSNR